MNLSHCRQLFQGLALSMILAAAPLAASAHGNIWEDESAPVTSYQRIVLYPVRDMKSEGLLPSAYPEWNDELVRRLGKRIKHTEFLWFQGQSDTKTDKKGEIAAGTPTYQTLLQTFPSEDARTQAVYAATGADGYLLPRLRFQKERTDVSPATWTNVTVESYYNVDNGPRGSEWRRNWRIWPMMHFIPEMRRTLRMIDCDFTLYDARTHKKAMTLFDSYRCYGADSAHAYEVITKNFAGDWSRLNGKKRKSVPDGAPTLHLEDLVLPKKAAQDSYAADTIAYAFRDEADSSMKHVKIDARPDGGRYVAGGTIHTYEQGERWNPPSVSTTMKINHIETFTWRDDKGGAHTGTRTYYVTDIQDIPGGYDFFYHVNATLYLKDRQTGAVIFSKTYDREDSERYANALHAMFGDFYREADKRIGKMDARTVELLK